MDKISSKDRSETMKKVHSKDTTPEKLVRSFLFSKGLRFRKNDKRYPGHPDIVLPKSKAIVFVNGCFWHLHDTGLPSFTFTPVIFMACVATDCRESKRSALVKVPTGATVSS